MLVTTVPNGTRIDLDGLAQSFSYNSDGTLNYITMTLGSISYRQSHTYQNGKVLTISQWVQQ